MAEQRRKGKQLNFRLSDQLAEQFEEYCGNRGITMTQFLENSIRQALGRPLSIPPDALGLPQRIANVETTGTAISASEVQGLAELVREIVRSELTESSGELAA
jgi:hypothetical protein